VQTLNTDSVASVETLAVFPDNRIATGGHDSAINIWDIRTSACLTTMKEKNWVDQRAIHALTVLENDSLVSAGYHEVIKTWDPRNGKPMQSFIGHKKSVYSLLRLSNILVSGSSDETVRFWSTTTSECVQTLKAHKGGVHALAWLPDGYVVTASSDELIKIWSFPPLQSTGIQVVTAPPITVPSSSPSPIASEHTIKPSAASSPSPIASERTIKPSAAPANTPPKAIIPPSKALPGLPTATTAKALYDFTATDNTQLGFKAGQILTILEKRSEGWWLAKYEQQQGWVPSNYFEMLKKPLPPPPPAKATAVTATTIATMDNRANIQLSTIPSQELEIGAVVAPTDNFYIVYKGKHKQTDVVVKKLAQQQLDQDTVSRFKQEASFLARLRSPHVLQLRGICVEPSNYAVVMESFAVGNLYHLLQSKLPLEWNIRYQIAVDIGAGLAYLHKEEIIHGNLTSFNVLLNDSMRAKITGFEFAQLRMNSANRSGRTKSSLRWQAPELVEESVPNTNAGDVFSYGVILWELSSGKVPFAEVRDEELSVKAKEGKPGNIPVEPPLLATLIGQCWEKRAEARPRITTCIEALEEERAAYLQVKP
jgi:hypothetical protein